MAVVVTKTSREAARNRIATLNILMRCTGLRGEGDEFLHER